METMTHLRDLRHRYRITLAQLASCSGLSGQYISRAELGEIAATARLEAQMACAVESVISSRKEEILALEADFRTCEGRLLRKEELPSEQ